MTQSLDIQSPRADDFVNLISGSSLLSSDLSTIELTKFLESIIENIPNMIFLKEAKELRFVLFNRAGSNLLGYERTDLIGKNDFDFFPAEDAEFFARTDREVLRNKTLVEIREETVESRHRGTRYLHTKKIPLLGSDGEAKFLLGISEDITDRKRAETTQASEQFLQEIIGSMPQGILIVDRAGYARFANRKALRILQSTSEDLVGKRVGLPSGNRILAQIPAFADNAWFHDLAPEKKFDLGEYTFECGSQDECRVRISATELRTDSYEREHGGHAVIVFEEITEQWRFEKLKDEFFSLVAHELKTPVTTIRSYAQFMMLLGTDERLKMHDNAFNVIAGQSIRLAKLIQDLMEASRLQVGRFSLHTDRAEMGPLIDTVLNRFHRLHPEREVNWAVDKDLWVEMDVDRIEQVVDNFLSNAVKYSPDGGSIDVRAERRGTDAIVRISDKGLGIPEDKKSQIFKKYYRAHENTPYASVGGLGVGLYLSREFVVRHQGEVWFESEAGKGSTFFFSIPLILKDE